MIEKVYETPKGNIHYWMSHVQSNLESETNGKVVKTLVFLPGLTADHRLFDKQITYFEGKYNWFVWDAPGHAASCPFDLDFTLMDKARWLYEILLFENIKEPILIGQSMGGYVAQMFIELFRGEAKGFISIDSAPLQREYMTKIEIWLLKRMEPVYRYYPWKPLKKAAIKGCATSQYGRNIMHEMLMSYEGEQKRYAKLVGHGYSLLANAVEADLPYIIDCPVLLICGKKDRAGSCLRYNKAWHKKTAFRIEWIQGAGHNSNTDAPEVVCRIIGEFIKKLP